MMASGTFRNPLGSRPPNDSSQWAQDDDDRDVDFSLMGSGLLGGSVFLPTPAERAAYESGIEIRAKYVGSIEVPDASGMAMVITAISRVRAQHKLSGEKKPKMRFVMSTTGLRVFDEQTQLLRDTYDLKCISYIAILPSNRKVFAFITANDPRQRPRVFTCHVFKTNKKTHRIKETMGRCFTLATELWRQREEDTLAARKSGTRRVKPAQLDPVEDAHIASESPSTAPSATPSPDGSSFAAVLRAVALRVEGAAMPEADKNFVLDSLATLDALHGDTARENARLGARIAELQSNINVLKKKWFKTVQVAHDLTDRLSRERVAAGKGGIPALHRMSTPADARAGAATGSYPMRGQSMPLDAFPDASTHA